MFDRRRLAAMTVAALALGGSRIPAGRADEGGFADFLEDVRREARRVGIRESTLASAFRDVTFIARVVELDRRQPEGTMTFAEYMAKRVPPGLVVEARSRLVENHELLAEIERRFGVPGRYIVALWALESRFGEHMGDYPVIAALATLAYDARRSAFFRKELLAALRILDDGHITAERMVGSWAGAMGQNQFLPSSFQSYAVDFDDDGRRDIWTSRADVLASAANYLARAGWRGAEWGLAVRLPDDFDASLAGNRIVKTVAAWRGLGVKPVDGQALPVDSTKASVITPAGRGGPAFLVLGNYQAILRWNRSDYFAMSVVSLADRIGSP
jgi:membrane-bound lytic murein transglycosylase B